MIKCLWQLCALVSLGIYLLVLFLMQNVKYKVSKWIEKLLSCFYMPGWKEMHWVKFKVVVVTIRFFSVWNIKEYILFRYDFKRNCDFICLGWYKIVQVFKSPFCIAIIEEQGTWCRKQKKNCLFSILSFHNYSNYWFCVWDGGKKASAVLQWYYILILQTESLFPVKNRRWDVQQLRNALEWNNLQEHTEGVMGK